MLRPSIIAAPVIPLACLAQVTGTFSVDKSVFAPGEPVFLVFTLSNQGQAAQEVLTSDPYFFCSGYEIKISPQGARPMACDRYQGFAGRCVSGVITLAPHGSRSEKILLNYPNTSRGPFYPPVSHPGNYTVDAFRRISSEPLNPQSSFFESHNFAETEVHQLFDLRVDATLTAGSSLYQPFVRQLAEQVRREAAQTLATVAPPSLEPLLLTSQHRETMC
jgi:hypothetical protein